MAPPADATKPSQPAANPFVLEEETAPPSAPAASPAPAATAPAAPAPAPVVAPAAQLAPQPASATKLESAPKAKSGFEYSFWRRLNLVVGGGGSFGTRVYADAEPYNMAAQKLKGPMFFIQPSITLVAGDPRADKPRGDFELRVGADIKDHILTNSSDQSIPDASVSAISVGGLVEGIFHFARHVGVGGNVNFGWMGLSSSNADVGAPFTATLDWGSEGGLTMGGQVFLTFWDGNLRVAGQLDSMLNTFDLNAGQGNPALKTGMDPIVGFSVGADVLGIIRSATEEKSTNDKK